MRKPLLILLLLSLVITVKAQQNNNKTADTQVVQPQETKPEPPGGIDAFNKYMKRFANRDYNNADAGTVTLSFVVEKDGSLTGAKIVKSFNKEADGIAINVLKDYDKKWKPATQNGQPESVPYTVVVPFGKD